MSLQPESVALEQSAGLAGDPDAAVRAVALRAKAAVDRAGQRAARGQGRGAARRWPTRCSRRPTSCSPPTQRDVEAAAANGTAAAMIDRLTLTPARIEAMADGLRQVAGAARPGRRGRARQHAAPTGSRSGRCGCRSGSSASSTRRVPT